MEYIIETFIYLLAILGIIFTSISFYEMFDLKKYINNTYRIFSRKNIDERKNVEVVIKIRGLDELEEKELIENIKNSESINLKEISNNITIEKEDS